MKPVQILEFIGALVRLLPTAPAADRAALMAGVRYMLGLLTRLNLSEYGSDPLISQNLGKLLSLCQTLSQTPEEPAAAPEKLLHAATEALDGLKGARGFGLGPQASG